MNYDDIDEIFHDLEAQNEEMDVDAEVFIFIFYRSDCYFDCDNDIDCAMIFLI